MLHLLDTSVLIDAKNKYYKFEQVPQFWTWLEDKANGNQIKIPYEIFLELIAGTKKDALSNWVNNNKKSLLLDEEIDTSLVRRVTTLGYANDLTDSEVKKIGNDPFLIAYALADISNRCVVTMEESKPNRLRANRHIPDVCDSLNIICKNTFELLDDLNFKIL